MEFFNNILHNSTRKSITIKDFSNKTIPLRGYKNIIISLKINIFNVSITILNYCT